jgi:hypothetical protein
LRLIFVTNPKDKDTDLHRPDGTFFKGDRVGHADERSHIRKRDGVVFRGEEIGYVDEERRIRKRDGIIFKGEVVGQVKDQAAHAKDGIFFEGEQWGYVDDEGNVRQKDGLIFRGRIIGKMRGHNKAAALGFFVLRFTKLEERYQELEREIRSAKNKVALLGKVRHMLDYVPKAEALGDFDGLLNKLRNLEREITNEQSRNRSRKEDLCRRAESLSHPTEWKTTGEKLKALQQEWKTVGSAGRDEDESLWQRFRAAQDKFYERRKEHFERQDQERQRNRAKKESLCARAESLSSSSDWKNTAQALKSLQEEWKQIGSAGKEQEDALWGRFRHAQDKFFERRSAHFEQRDREQRENLHRKERICSEAESLIHSSDPKAATERIKELQAKWKEIGHVPRDQADTLWDRFRHACDRVFEHARHERERKQEEWRNKMQDALDRKRQQAGRLRESIEHDEGNISRWQDTIYNLRPGGHADDIRYDLESRISDVEDRIRSKRHRLDELEDSISDIEARLHR